ncbi:hypothetical protein JCM16303_003081 [Sporobolomyces ruberrimus]
MSITARATKLPRLLSLLPKDGVGSLIYQSRWKGKGFPVPPPTSSPSNPAQDACYYEVKKVHLAVNDEGKLKGQAFGVLYWKGKRVTPLEREFEPIRGTKYFWQAANPPLVLRQEAIKEPKVVPPTTESP